MTQPLVSHSPDPHPIRVLLVCNERVIRAALRALIDGQIGTTVIGEIDGLDMARTSIVNDRPDVTVVDPDQYSREDIAELVRTGVTKTRIIILTGVPKAPAIADSLENGAVGLVLKQQPPEALIKAINKVFAGELWLDRTATARLGADLARTTPGDHDIDHEDKTTYLTRREREVVVLVGQGLRNSQIAERLSISEVTVRNHLTSTFRKLELENRFQLVIYAFQHGLATLPARAASAAPSDVPATLEYKAKTS